MTRTRATGTRVAARMAIGGAAARLAPRAVRAALAGAALAAALALAACGGRGAPTLKVGAAASLAAPLGGAGTEVGGARVAYSFAGSDELAAQIRSGAALDVFAAANATLPDALLAAGKVERPVAVTTNTLVVAVRPGAGRVRTLADLGEPGVRVALGAAAVPIGAYTRQALARLDPGLARRIRANVVTNEPDTLGIVGKVRQGGADAGLVYATDVRASRGALAAVPIPARVQPRIIYEAAVVRTSRHPAQARAYIAWLARGAGQRALRRAGFGPPPP